MNHNLSTVQTVFHNAPDAKQGGKPGKATTTYQIPDRNGVMVSGRTQPDGTTVPFKDAADAMQFMADEQAALRQANEALKTQVAQATTAAPASNLRLAKYSTKWTDRNGKAHPKAGQYKGTFELYSCGSQYAALVCGLDQWADIKARIAEIDAFVEANREHLKNVRDIIDGK